MTSGWLNTPLNISELVISMLMLMATLGADNEYVI